MSDEILVTFAVAAYNAEATLESCLRSFRCPEARGCYEVLVVSDGSTDGTQELASRFVREEPDVYRLIVQENRGHGGALNTAAANARGKYFRPIDADDWICTEQLPRYLAALSGTNTDAVVTDYCTVHQKTGKRRYFSCACDAAGRELSLPELLSVFDEVHTCLTFHGISYRTEFYRACGLSLSEKVFYEDQEYASLPFLSARTVLLLPLLLYRYRIGDANQSVAAHNQVKRIGQIEQVTLRMARDWNECRNPEPGGRDLVLRKLVTVAVSYHVTALLRNPNRKEGHEQSLRFEQTLARVAPDVNRLAARKLKTLRFFHRIHLSPVLYQRLLDSRLYGAVRGLWRGNI